MKQAPGEQYAIYFARAIETMLGYEPPWPDFELEFYLERKRYEVGSRVFAYRKELCKRK